VIGARARSEGRAVAAIKSRTNRGKGLTMAKQYQGHPSWNAWNVALWIANEEWLYRAGVEACKQSTTWRGAVRRFDAATGVLGARTPDGARYNPKGVRLALQGLEVPLMERKAA